MFVLFKINFFSLVGFGFVCFFLYLIGKLMLSLKLMVRCIIYLEMVGYFGWFLIGWSRGWFLEVWIGLRGLGFFLICKLSFWICVLDLCNKVLGLLILLYDSYVNLKYVYIFFWVSVMLGDGKMFYDYDWDNEGNEIGGCLENFRRRGDVLIKVRLIYVKGRVL